MTGADCLALAKCEVCPLGKLHRKAGTFAPIVADISQSQDVLVIGPAPGKYEVDNATPLTGPLGVDLLSMMERQGLDRDDVSWTSHVMCRYPRDDESLFLGKLRKKNRDRADMQEPNVRTPAVCCRPRLDAEMASHKVIVTLGSGPLKAVGTTNRDTGAINNNPGIDGIRGTPALTATGKKLLATRSDWRRNPKWRTIVVEDIEKALRYARDELTWKDPKMIFRPTWLQVSEFLFKVDEDMHIVPRHRAAVYDVECGESGFDPKENRLFDAMTDPLRCIGIGNQDEVIVIPFLGVDGTTTFYSDHEMGEIKMWLRRWFTDPDVLKVGHNSHYYDRLVTENHLGVTPWPILDTHPLCKLAEPEYPKGLGFQGSRYTDAPSWKDSHTATEAETDEELWTYNARDCAINAAIVKPLMDRAKKRKHARFVPTYTQLQDWCVGMHKLGLRVHEPTRLKHEARLEAQVTKAHATLERIGGTHNPGSYVQVQRILYDTWGLPILKVTGTGEPSTDDDTIRALLATGACEKGQEVYLHALRKYRGSEKQLGSYVRQWAPSFGLVDGKGFLHPDYNAAGTVMWRFSARNPAAQTMPFDLRDCFIPPDGMSYVAADYDQLELRGAAGLASVGVLLDVIEDKSIDLHNKNGEMIFGEDYWKIDGAPKNPMLKGTGPFAKRRKLVKEFVFGSIYAAKAPTILNILTSAEDDDGHLMFLGLTVREVRTMHARWMRAFPEFATWWKSTRTFWRKHGYVEEPVFGMRRYCVEDNLSELVNAPSQGLGGAITHIGTKKALDAFDFKKGEGLCLQVHDSIVFCVADDAADELRQTLNEKLTVTTPLGADKRPVTFTAEAKTGRTLKEI